MCRTRNAITKCRSLGAGIAGDISHISRMILNPEYANCLCVKARAEQENGENWFLNWSYESIWRSFWNVLENNCLCGSVLRQCASLHGTQMSRHKVNNVWVFIYHSTQRNMTGLIFNDRLFSFLFITSVYTYLHNLAEWRFRFHCQEM